MNTTSSSTSQTPSPISTSEQAHYKAHGYVLVRQLIAASDCSPVRQRLNDLIEKDPDWPEGHFQRIDTQKYARPDGSGLPGGVQRPAAACQDFHAIAHHPRLISAMGSLLESDVQLFTDQALIKYGRVNEEQAGRSYYHQDSHYWKLAPEQGCNCWIALDEVGHDAICLAIMPGSHRSGKLLTHESYYDEPSLCDRNGQPFKRHRVPHSTLDMSKEVVIPMQPGDGLFFTNYTLHRSEPNRTGNDLAAYAIAYQRKV